MFFNTMMMGTMGFQYNFPTLPTETTFLGTSSNLVTADYAQMNVSNSTDQVANFGQGLFYVLEHHNGNSRYFRTTVSSNSTSYTTHNLPRAAFSGISTVGGSGPVGDIFYYSNGTTIYEYDHSTSSDTGTTYTAGVDHDCFVISDPVVYLADYDSTQDEVTVHARRWPGMQPIKSVVVSNTLSASQFRAMDITIDSSGMVLFTDYSGNVYGVDFNLETSFVVDDDGVGQSIGISYDPALDSVFILRANSPYIARFYERQVGYGTPTISSGPATITVPETTSTSTVLGTYTVSSGGPVQWAVTGTDAGAFDISSSGQLTFNHLQNYENSADRLQSIDVVAVNPLGTDSQAVSIYVTDVFLETGTYIGEPTAAQLSTYNSQSSNIGTSFDVPLTDGSYLFLMHLNEPNPGDLSYFIVDLSTGRFLNSGTYWTQSLPTITSGLGSNSQHRVIEHVWQTGSKFYVLSNTATHNGYSAPCLYSDTYAANGSTFTLLGQVSNWPGGTTGLDIATTSRGSTASNTQLFVMKGGTTGDPEFIEISGISTSNASLSAGSVVKSGLSITNLPTGFDVSRGIAYMDGPSPDRFIFGGSGDLVTVAEYDPPSNFANVVATQSWDDLGDMVSFSGFSFDAGFRDAIVGDGNYLYYWHKDSSYTNDYKLYRFTA